MKRKIELYGRLKDAGFGSSLTVEIPASATARAVLLLLKPSLRQLLHGCVLASNDAVLSPTDKLPKGTIALLPPVCGG